MKRLIIFGVALSALAAGTAYAYLGQVITSYPAPANNPIALAARGTTFPYYIYVYCHTSPYRIHKLDYRDGSVYSSFISPQGPYTRGLTYSWGGGGGLPAGAAALRPGVGMAEQASLRW